MSMNGITSNHVASAKHGDAPRAELNELRLALGLTEKDSEGTHE